MKDYTPYQETKRGIKSQFGATPEVGCQDGSFTLKTLLHIRRQHNPLVTKNYFRFHVSPLFFPTFFRKAERAVSAGRTLFRSAATPSVQWCIIA